MQQPDSFDDLAKSLLSDLQRVPRARNWEHIQAGLHGTQTDKLFKQLKDVTIPPAPQNWNRIERRLPWRLVYRRQLRFALRVAAVFLLTFCLPSLLERYVQHRVEPVSEFVQLTTPTFGQMVEAATQEEIIVPVITTTHVKPLKSTSRSKVEILLASVLADDQEFPDSLLDITRLQSILQPIEPLPVISAVARIETLPVSELRVRPAQAENIELSISVPLIFVEEGEAEQLIKLYEEKH